MGSLSSNRHRRQDAVLWTMAGTNEFNRPIVNPPVPLKVRWVEELEIINDTQNEAVMTEVKVDVDRLIPIGSIMWLGKITELEDPVGNLDFYKVMFRKTTPNVKATRTRYQVLLSRYTQTLPDIV